jgi:hypothetical protein
MAFAVGTLISEGPPRTEPDAPNSGIRLPSRLLDGEALAWPGMKDKRPCADPKFGAVRVESRHYSARNRRSSQRLMFFFCLERPHSGGPQVAPKETAGTAKRNFGRFRAETDSQAPPRLWRIIGRLALIGLQEIIARPVRPPRREAAVVGFGTKTGEPPSKPRYSL